MCEISFNNPVKRRAKEQTTSTLISPATPPTTCKLIPQKVLLETLFSVAPNAAVFTTLPGYSSGHHLEHQSLEPEIPSVLTDMYDPELINCSPEELAEKCLETFFTISVTQDQCNFLEQSTRGQSYTRLWYDHRCGRITASKFFSVVRCKEKTFPKSIVQDIMQYTGPNPQIPSLKWGREKEPVARHQYIQDAQVVHTNLQVKPIGLVINTKYPFLGATPDGSVSCTCCGMRLLEIKCPYTYKDTNPSLICESDPKFYLKKDQNGELYLDTTHQYYYQVQGQLAICEKQSCDFVVWTQAGMVITSIEYKSTFFTEMLVSLESFFLRYILPELMTRRLEDIDVECTSSVTTERSAVPLDSTLPSIQGASVPPSDSPLTQSYCYCGEGEHGRMIACDNGSCSKEWFHYKCVGIQRKPKGKWYCTECKQNMS